MTPKGLVALLALGLSACFVNGPSRPGAANPSDYRLVGFESIEPQGMHRGLWLDVVHCLPLELRAADPPTLEDIAFGIADSIVARDAASGREYLPYGVTLKLRPDPARDPYTWLIVLEWRYFWFPPTVSHEMLHALADVRDHPPEVFRCASPSPLGLPIRWLGEGEGGGE